MTEISIHWHHFQRQLDSLVAETIASKQSLALVLVQLRQLPVYNLQWGFAAGEAAVAEAMARLVAMVKYNVAIERIAPDKIALVIGQVPVTELLALSAQNIIDGLAEPFRQGDMHIAMDTAVGIAVLPEHGQSAAALISAAELSLRAIVRQSATFQIADRMQTEKYLAHFQLQTDLHRALHDGLLALHYQPKFELASLRPTSIEALMRWHLQDGGKVDPGKFIAIAEADGTIHGLTEWAINTALRECAEFPGGDQDFGVAVNVSASSLYDPTFVESVGAALAIWGATEGALTLEITETALMRDPDVCFLHLSRLRDLGVRIAIDDFGTGFSSLAYFKKIPANEIKIDQSFIATMDKDPDDEKIVAAIIDLSHKFGHQVVAEGIENSKVLAKLQAMGCDMGQGFYLARPMGWADCLAAWRD